MRLDPLIIGAGPAGSAAAIVLARAGHRPILIERTTGPTDKICGDFLSSDTIRQSKALGVDPAGLGAVSINRVRLVHGEWTAETALPFPAMSLSRRVLDDALLRQAVRSGAVVRMGETVRRLIPESNGWAIQTDQTARLAADTVFLATGKHDLRDQPRARAGHGAIGMKMYLALAPVFSSALSSTIELTMFPGGYAGLQPVENGHATLCIAVQRSVFQNLGGGWGPLLATISNTSRRFAAMMTDARPLLPKPLAVAAIPYGYLARQAAAEGLFRLGDQAAVIPSLTGDGMAIALHTGQAAGESWLAGGSGAAYHQELTRILAPQMRFAGLLHRACMNAAIQTAAVRTARLFPGLMRHAASRTRLRSSR